MKSNITMLITLLTLANAGSLTAGGPSIGVQIIEDVSGPELEKHGIQAAGFEDMQVLADVLFSTRQSATLGYDVVDEDSHDNPPLHFAISPFETPIPTRPDFKGLTVRDKMTALKNYETATAAFRKENDQWRAKVLEGAKAWLDQCVEHRLQVEENFLQRLKADHNRDFRRSDIIGAIQKANEQLFAAKTRFLILNSDLDHKPGAKARNKDARALTISDLAADITIIVVNTSRQPDKSLLLRGLPNPVLHADSLQQAAELIATELRTAKPQPTGTGAGTNAAANPAQ